MLDGGMASAVRSWLAVMNVIAMVLLVLMGTSRVWLPTLNRVTAMVRRSWFGPLLVLVFVCGMVHYAATKGTNGMDRAGHQAESKIVGTDESRDGDAGRRDGRCWCA